MKSLKIAFLPQQRPGDGVSLALFNEYNQNNQSKQIFSICP